MSVLFGKLYDLVSNRGPEGLCIPVESPDGQWAFVGRLFTDVPTLHRRRCHECGNEAWHADSVTPYVLCRKCGSQDTRRPAARRRGMESVAGNNH